MMILLPTAIVRRQVFGSAAGRLLGVSGIRADGESLHAVGRVAGGGAHEIDDHHPVRVDRDVDLIEDPPLALLYQVAVLVVLVGRHDELVGLALPGIRIEAGRRGYADPLSEDDVDIARALRRNSSPPGKE